MRTMSVAVLFILIFGCFGCVTTPESKKVENKVAENQVSEWQKVPDDPKLPGQQGFRNTRTDAFVSISFLSGKMEVSAAADQEAERMFDNGIETSDVELSNNDETGTFTFTTLLSGRPVNGMVTIMRLAPNRPLPMILGVWPIEFDDEMTVHYKGITKEVVDRLKSIK